MSGLLLSLCISQSAWRCDRCDSHSPCSRQNLHACLPFISMLCHVRAAQQHSLHHLNDRAETSLLAQSWILHLKARNGPSFTPSCCCSIWVKIHLAHCSHSSTWHIASRTQTHITSFTAACLSTSLCSVLPTNCSHHHPGSACIHASCFSQTTAGLHTMLAQLHQLPTLLHVRT